LIHAHPIASSQLQVKMGAPPGDVLSVIVDVRSTRPVDELFETVVAFLGQRSPAGEP
jgi:hypothetical protein